MNLRPRDLWRWLAVTTVGGALALGLVVDPPWPPTQPRRPAWAAHLSPLQQAPLARGEPVPLILPEKLTPEDAEELFMEIVWQRPDVDWRRSRDLPAERGLGKAVLVIPQPGGQPPPPGWHRTWRRGWISIVRREKP